MYGPDFDNFLTQMEQEDDENSEMVTVENSQEIVLQQTSDTSTHIENRDMKQQIMSEAIQSIRSQHFKFLVESIIIDIMIWVVKLLNVSVVEEINADKLQNLYRNSSLETKFGQCIHDISETETPRFGSFGPLARREKSLFKLKEYQALLQFYLDYTELQHLENHLKMKRKLNLVNAFILKGEDITMCTGVFVMPFHKL